MGFIEFILGLLFTLALIVGLIVLIFLVELKKSGYLELYLKNELEKMSEDNEEK
jgi:hypothetical protein